METNLNLKYYKVQLQQGVTKGRWNFFFASLAKNIPVTIARKRRIDTKPIVHNYMYIVLNWMEKLRSDRKLQAAYASSRKRLTWFSPRRSPLPVSTTCLTATLPLPRFSPQIKIIRKIEIIFKFHSQMLVFGRWPSYDGTNDADGGRRGRSSMWS